MRVNIQNLTITEKVKTCLLLCLGIFFFSCASVNKEEKVEEVIKEKDFDLSAKIQYDKLLDFIPNLLDKNFSSLIDETLDRVDRNQLYKYDLDKDPLLQGTSFCHMKKKGNAFNVFDQNYRELKNSPIYWNSVGLCYLIDKDYREAKLYLETANSFYQIATKSNKSYAPALNNLGVLYTWLGNDEHAMEYFKKVLQDHPKSKTASFNLGQLYLKYGIIEKALPYFEYLNDVNDNDFEVHGALGLIHFLKKDLDKANRYYQKISKENLKLPHLGLPYVYLTLLRGNLAEAESTYKLLVKPNDPSFKVFYYAVNEHMLLEIEKEKARQKAIAAEKAKKLELEKSNKNLDNKLVNPAKNEKQKMNPKKGKN
jgi:tetratricopeptide (TPR) repeat protein